MTQPHKNKRRKGVQGPIGREEFGTMRSRTRPESVGLPPLMRVKRAPGEINPRKGKSGGLNRGGKMIE